MAGLTQPRMLRSQSHRAQDRPTPAIDSRAYIGNVSIDTYDDVMKTITITIPEELDAEAAAEAKRLGISKSELIRRGLATLLPDRSGSVEGDPWHELAGFASEEASAEPGEIDRVIYDS